jgi:hypothetical protein
MSDDSGSDFKEMHLLEHSGNVECINNLNLEKPSGNKQENNGVVGKYR